MGYVYKRSEPQLWTVGYYTPAGKFDPESDHSTEREASDRVRYLNGGTLATYATDADPANSTKELLVTAIESLGDTKTTDNALVNALLAIASAQVALVGLAERQAVALERLAGAVSGDGDYLDIAILDRNDPL